MQDIKIKAAKEYYESVGMTLEQVESVLETLGFNTLKKEASELVSQRNNITMHYKEKSIKLIELTCCTDKTFRIIENPRYANQIQQLIKDTNENTI